MFRTYKLGGRRTNRFFDDTAPAPAPEPTPEPVPAPTPAPTEEKSGRFYTQDEINRIVKADKDRVKKENETLLGELQKLKEQGITGENLDNLNKRIERIQEEGKTKEQLASERIDKANKEWTKKLGQAETASKAWEEKYKTYRIKNELYSAAVSNKAYNPEQVYEIIRGWTSLVEEQSEDGKPTGELVPRVKLRDMQDGKPVELTLSPAEAIKRMTEMEQHANLFASGASGGLGGGNNGRQGTGGTAVPTSMEGYMKYRGKGGENLRKQTHVS